MFPFGHRSTGQEPSPKASLLVQGRGAFLGIPKLFLPNCNQCVWQSECQKNMGHGHFLWTTPGSHEASYSPSILSDGWKSMIPHDTIAIARPGTVPVLPELGWWKRSSNSAVLQEPSHQVRESAILQVSFPTLSNHTRWIHHVPCVVFFLFRHVPLYSSMYAPMFFIFFHDVPYWCSCSFPNLFWYALHVSCFLLVSTMIVPPRFGGHRSWTLK